MTIVGKLKPFDLMALMISLTNAQVVVRHDRAKSKHSAFNKIDRFVDTAGSHHRVTNRRQGLSINDRIIGSSSTSNIVSMYFLCLTPNANSQHSFHQTDE